MIHMGVKIVRKTLMDDAAISRKIDDNILIELFIFEKKVSPLAFHFTQRQHQPKMFFEQYSSCSYMKY